MRPAYRSRSKRKIYRRSPSGKVKITIRERKKENRSCEICGSKINIKKDKKIIGNVCDSCLHTIITYYTRIINNDMKLDDVDLIYRSYVEKLLKK
jgi:hypothetical protein